MNRNVFNSDDKMNGSNHKGFDKNWEIPHLSHSVSFEDILK